MKHYVITVDVRDEFAPSMKQLTDAVADALEKNGCWETDYEVVTEGPPELSIVVVPR